MWSTDMPWLDTGVESGNVVVDLLDTFDIRMPQVVKKESWIRLPCILRDFLKSWLDCPRLIELCYVMPLADRRFDGSVILLKWFWLTERVFVPPNIRCMNFFAVKQKGSNADSDIRIMQSLCLSRSFEKCVFSRKLFVRQVNTRFRVKPYRSQDTFCNSMLSN